MQNYGYGPVFLVILLEAVGAPLPGESLLIGAGFYAAATQRIGIGGLVAVAFLGGMAGDNISYAVGRVLGTRLLVRYGSRVGITEKRLRLGRYLFRRHGGWLVVFGRFVVILRTLMALLAGANRMRWGVFFLWNLAGNLIWGGGYCLGGYYLGDVLRHVGLRLGIGLGLIAFVGIGGLVWVAKRREEEWLHQAEQDMDRGGG